MSERKNKRPEVDLDEEQLDTPVFEDDFDFDDFNVDDDDDDDDVEDQEPNDEIDDVLADDDLQEVDLDVLQDTVVDLETIVDNLVIMNKNKELSRVIKLLQSATRFIDEIVSSEDLM